MDRDRIPLVKAIVRGSSVEEAEALVREALAMEQETEVAELLRSRLESRFAAVIDGFVPQAAAA